MPPRACNPPKPLSTHCHMLHSRQYRRSATTPISRMDDTRHSNPDAMRWRIPSCDPGHDVRDPQPDRDRVVGPSAGGQPGLRDRGHSETAIDIGANLPFLLSIDALAYRKWIAQTIRPRSRTMFRRGQGAASAACTGATAPPRAIGDGRPQKTTGTINGCSGRNGPLGCCATTSDATRPFGPDSDQGTQSPTDRGWRLCPEPC